MIDRPTATGAGWFPDPLGRYDHRWFNGTAWTADVSVDGGRFVDPSPLAALEEPDAAMQMTYGAAPVTPGAPFGGLYGGLYGGSFGGPSQPPRTLAVLALIAGLVSVLTGWMPFVFVIGAIAGVAAIVLAVVARRRASRGLARGRGMALAGLILGPIGLASCVVGVVLSGVLLRELREYTEPGPLEVAVESCEVEGRTVRTSGTIENLDDQTHDYSIVIEVLDGRDAIDRDNVRVDDVAPGAVRRWEHLLLMRRDNPADAVCDVFAVNGPFPFGLDPNP